MRYSFEYHSGKPTAKNQFFSKLGVVLRMDNIGLGGAMLSKHVQLFASYSFKGCGKLLNESHVIVRCRYLASAWGDIRGGQFMFISIVAHNTVADFALWPITQGNLKSHISRQKLGVGFQ